jgi:hypothetical protein
MGSEFVLSWLMDGERPFGLFERHQSTPPASVEGVCANIE